MPYNRPITKEGAEPMSNLGNKEIMAKNIRYQMRKNGVTAKDVCNTLKIPMATFSDWTNAKTYPRIDKIELLSNYFGISKADLVEDNTPSIPQGFSPLPKTVKVPLIGNIACGKPITAEENIEGYVDVPADYHCDFCLKCVGDSMVDAGISDGDIVYIRSQPEVENGQIAAVRISGEATLKRLYKTNDTLTLIPENRNYPPIILSGVQLSDVHIEGKAVGFTHWF
jgi:repressor LexA